MNTILEIINVKKKFKISAKQRKIDKTTDKVKVAVNGVSFNAYEGEIYGLLGSNGAGKTTLLRMISTLISPDEGDIKVFGKSVKDDPSSVRKNIAFLTSELKLEDFLTPNYLFDFYSDLHGVLEDEREKRKQKLFSKFGIDKFAEVKVGELSTGMKQKASLAISLVHDPKLIIFDEPTNGLDVLTAKVVTDFLVDLKQQGKTIIISTHIFSLIEKICDRVGIIVDGKKVKDDLLVNICKEKNLEEVFFDIYKEAAGEM